MLTILIYFSYFFFKLDMTTIRAAISVALMLLSIEDIESKDYISFYTKIIIACLFHLSAVVYLFLIFLDTKRLNKFIYFLLLNGSFVIALMHIDVAARVPLMGGMFSKIKYYSLLASSGIESAASFLSVVNIFYLLIFNVFIYYSDYLYQRDKYAIIFIKLSVYAMACLFFFFSLSPIVAGRAQDLFGIAMCISLLYLLYLVKPRWFVIIFLIFYSAYYFVAIVYRNPLVVQYTTSF